MEQEDNAVAVDAVLEADARVDIEADARDDIDAVLKENDRRAEARVRRVLKEKDHVARYSSRAEAMRLVVAEEDGTTIYWKNGKVERVTDPIVRMRIESELGGKVPVLTRAAFDELRASIGQPDPK